MSYPLGRCNKLSQSSPGLTLIELMMSIVIFGIITTVVFSVFSTSNTLYWTTSERANLQMNSRTAIELMAQEIRSAGADPSVSGLGGILTATSDSIRIQADLSGDGAIQTAEPSEDVLYYFDPANETLVRNPGTGPQAIVHDVTNVAFSYFDASNSALTPLPLTPNLIAQIRSIGVTITADSRRGGEVDYVTRVGLRNF